MPSFKDTLELVLHADASGAISELKTFAGEAETQTKKAESSLQRLSSGALKIGAGGMGAGALLTSLGDQATAATQQLDAAISAAGQSAEEYKGKIDDAVSSDEKFGHTAHETEGALTTLVGSYGDTSQALGRMQLVEDLAAEKHIDLASAANLVAKAHGGAGRIFKEFNIQVKTNADGTKDYEGALDELSKKVSGQASASMAGFTGWLKGVGAAVEDDVASFGQKFGPAILGASTGLTALGGIGTGVSSVLSKLKGSTDEAGEGAMSLKSKLGVAGIGAGAAIGVAALYELGQSLNKTGLDEQDLANITKLSFDQQAQYAVQLVEKFKGPFAGAVDDLIKKYEGMGDVGKESLIRIRDALKAAGQDTSKFDAAIDGMNQSQENAKEVTDKTTTAVDTYAEAIKKARDATKAADDEQKHYAQTLKGITDPFFALVDAADRQSKAQEDVMVKTKALDDAVQQHGRDSEEARKAQDDLTQANYDAVKAASDLTQSVMNLEASVKNGSTSIDNAKIVLANWVAQGLITQAQADQVAGRLDNLKTQADDLNGTDAKISVSIDATQAEAELKKLLDDTGSFAAAAREAANTPGQSASGPEANPLAGLPPGIDVGAVAPPTTGGGGSVTRTSAFAPVTVNNYITTTDPVQAGNHAAQAVRAGQFLGVR